MPLRSAVMWFATAIGLALIGTSTAVGLAGSAGAAPQDQAFLDRLDEVGITYTNPYAITMYARGVCRELDLEVPHSRVIEFVRGDYPALDWESAADYVIIAYMTYCPWNRTA